ncbi:hypothetical protein GCM10009675_43630 [Prauserella alba]|uniref:Uncharacterized protein n=1 Tax=Prauserella alba TaxID=176898 RepID=A0ABP4GCQ2_9PSEU
MTSGQATTPIKGNGEKIKPIRPTTKPLVPSPLRGGSPRGGSTAPDEDEYGVGVDMVTLPL